MVHVESKKDSHNQEVAYNNSKSYTSGSQYIQGNLLYCCCCIQLLRVYGNVILGWFVKTIGKILLYFNTVIFEGRLS